MCGYAGDDGHKWLAGLRADQERACKLERLLMVHGRAVTDMERMVARKEAARMTEILTEAEIEQAVLRSQERDRERAQSPGYTPVNWSDGVWLLLVMLVMLSVRALLFFMWPRALNIKCCLHRAGLHTAIDSGV